MSGVQADFSGAIKKTQGLLNIPKATRKELVRFADDAIFALKRRAGTMQKGYRKTTALSRSVGKKMETTGDFYKATVGTGLGTSPFANKMAQKYASIQDKGGVIKAKNYRPTRTSGFGLAPKYIKKLVFRTKDGKWHMVDKVTIPGSLWFTATWEHRMAFLKTNYLNDKVILKTAQDMSGGSNA